MSESNIRDMLVSYVRDAHAMEENVATMLDSMIATTNDESILEILQHHREETDRHAELLSRRLEDLGGKTAAMKDVPAIMGAMAKGLVDAVRSDKPGKNARDAYMTEAMEIAAYRLLEELAERAGDNETAETARTIRKDEEAMREKIDRNWGKFIELTLQEEGVAA